MLEQDGIKASAEAAVTIVRSDLKFIMLGVGGRLPSVKKMQAKVFGKLSSHSFPCVDLLIDEPNGSDSKWNVCDFRTRSVANIIVSLTPVGAVSTIAASIKPTEVRVAVNRHRGCVIPASSHFGVS